MRPSLGGRLAPPNRLRLVRWSQHSHPTSSEQCVASEFIVTTQRAAGTENFTIQDGPCGHAQRNLINVARTVLMEVFDVLVTTIQ